MHILIEQQTFCYDIDVSCYMIDRQLFKSMCQIIPSYGRSVSNAHMMYLIWMLILNHVKRRSIWRVEISNRFNTMRIVLLLMIRKTFLGQVKQINGKYVVGVLKSKSNLVGIELTHIHVIESCISCDFSRAVLFSKRIRRVKEQQSNWSQLRCHSSRANKLHSSYINNV